jgi:hypothetical protein
MTSKNDCLNALSVNLAKTSNWRNQQASRWPEDNRNARAAQTLFDLAAQATELDEHHWALLQPLFGDRRFYEAVSAAAREVGFRSSPRTFDDFVESVLTTITVAA